MTIGPDSPLRKIPIALDRKQAFFIEGIRVSLEMIALAHERLQRALLSITNRTLANLPMEQDKLTSAVLDAWSVVDSVHRLCALVEHFPNLQHRSRVPAIRDLFEANKAINDLRNTVQHLPGHIHEMAATPTWSVWGALAWCVPSPTDNEGIIQCGMYFCGRMEPGVKPPFVNPIGKKILRPVGQITLTQSPASVGLSDIYEIVARFTTTIENALAATFDGKPELHTTFAADVLVVMGMKLEPGEPSQDAAS